MRILAFTDVHGDRELLEQIRQKSDQAELLVCTGDFTAFEHDMQSILEFLDRIGKPVLIIPGNHEDSLNLDKSCESLQNVNQLHGLSYSYGDFIFIGHGEGGFAQRDREFEQVIAPEFKALIAAKQAIFLTHMPPYNTTADLIGTDHVGSKSYREFIEQTQPIQAICGHLHENFHKEDAINHTRVINPGPDGTFIDL